MIAHSCTQTGLSEAFREVFNFEGSEFYLVSLPGAEGLSFEELMVRVNNAVPVGVYRDGKVVMNPPADLRLEAEDRVLVFSEDDDSAELLESSGEASAELPEAVMNTAEEATDILIIGQNETLPTILEELPENVSNVYLTERPADEEENEELQEIAERRHLVLRDLHGNLRSERFLVKLAKMAEHILILGNHDRDPEEADMEAIFLLMNLRDIRKRFDLDFNMTMEMQREHNQKLVGRGDHTDFLVSSSMSSLILAQLAESPELIDVFKELLSNRGNELYLKNVEKMGLVGTYSIRDLRRILLKQGAILLGHLDAEKHSQFNFPIDEELTLTADDYLIVLSEG